MGLGALVVITTSCEQAPPPPAPDLSTSPSAVGSGDADAVMRRAMERASSARNFLGRAKRDMNMLDGGAAPPSAPSSQVSEPSGSSTPSTDATQR